MTPHAPCAVSRPSSGACQATGSPARSSAKPNADSVLTPAAAVRSQVTDLAARLLAALGVPEGVRDVPASQLVVLVDALLMYDTSHAEPVDLETTLTAYLRGIIG